MLGNVIHGRKPTFSELLVSASLIQIHYNVRILGDHVARRIVEGQMAILTNTNKCNIDRVLDNQRIEPCAFCKRITTTLHIMERCKRNRQFVGEPLLQVLLKGSWVLVRDTTYSSR